MIWCLCDQNVYCAAYITHSLVSEWENEYQTNKAKIQQENKKTKHTNEIRVRKSVCKCVHSRVFVSMKQPQDEPMKTITKIYEKHTHIYTTTTTHNIHKIASK